MDTSIEGSATEGSAVERAFSDGTLTLTVDRAISGTRSLYTGHRSSDANVVLVHVMSRHTKGECRGYVLTTDGALRVRLPNYTGDWPAMDSAVLARVPGARFVVTA